MLKKFAALISDFLEARSNFVFLALRFVAGLSFSLHGMQKLFGFFTDKPIVVFPTQIWFGGVIELVTGLFMALGVAPRCMAFLASGTMAVAYTQFHWKGQLGEQLLPLVNKGELALIYCFLFLYFATRPSAKSSRHRGV